MTGKPRAGTDRFGKPQHLICKWVTVTIADPTAKRWGFEASPRVSSAASATGAGTVSTADSNTRIAGTKGTIQWITHTLAGTRNGTTGGVTFQFNWTVPSSDVGAVDFYVAANAANGNNQADSGDKIYTTKATLTAASAISNLPTITSGGVVNAASQSASIESGSWVTICGSNLAPATVATGRSWTAAEIVEGKLPLSLDGVNVAISGKPAAISWVSNNQLNVQAPDDASIGPFSVVVTNANGISSPATVNLQQYLPRLFMLTAKYPAAWFADGAYVGPAGVLGASLASRPALVPANVEFAGITGAGVSTQPNVSLSVQQGREDPSGIGRRVEQVSSFRFSNGRRHSHDRRVPAGLEQIDKFKSAIS